MRRHNQIHIYYYYYYSVIYIYIYISVIYIFRLYIYIYIFRLCILLFSYIYIIRLFGYYSVIIQIYICAYLFIYTVLVWYSVYNLNNNNNIDVCLILDSLDNTAASCLCSPSTIIICVTFSYFGIFQNNHTIVVYCCILLYFS